MIRYNLINSTKKIWKFAQTFYEPSDLGNSDEVLLVVCYRLGNSGFSDKASTT